MCKTYRTSQMLRISPLLDVINLIDEIMKKHELERLITNQRAEFKGTKIEEVSKIKNNVIRNTTRALNKKQLMRFVLVKPPEMRLFNINDYVDCRNLPLQDC